MATQLQIRRGTSAQIAAFTGAEGEIVVNTTNDSVHVNDGSTAGGFEMARVDGSNWAITNAISTTANISFGDNDKAIFGAGSDLQIYHDPSAGSIIQEAGAGSLFVRASTNIQLEGVNGENMAIFNENSSVQLYYDNAEKLATTSTGIDVTGTVTASEGFAMGNGDQISSTGSMFIDIDSNNDSNAATLDLTRDGKTKRTARFVENGDISFYEDTGTTPKLFWDASAESLGIGTSSPTGRLNIQSSASGQYLLNLDYADGTDGGGFYQSGSADLAVFLKNSSATQTVQIATADDSYFNGGNVGIGTSSPSAELSVSNGGAESYEISPATVIGGTIRQLAFNRSSSAYMPFRTQASQHEFYAGSSEAMRIDSSGNVGIGTSSPSATLEVDGVTNSTYLIVGGDDSSNGRALTFTSSASAAFNGAVHTINAPSSQGVIALSTGSTERMRIDSSGNVGIGTSSPKTEMNLSANNSGQGAVLTLENSDTGITTNDVIGQIDFYANDGSTNGTGAKVNIKAIASSGAGSNTSLTFGTSDSTSATAVEAMRIDASGNLLVGVTSVQDFTATTTNGHTLYGGSVNAALHSRSGNAALAVQRTTDDGAIVNFFRDTTAVGSIGTVDGFAYISSNSNVGLKFLSSRIRPVNSDGSDRDDAIDLGASSARFDDIYATNGTIQTSDRNEKQDIEALSDAEQRVAVAAKGLLRKFRWKSSVAENGDDARIHFGIIAQDLQAAFTAEGLDAGRYAMFISSTWTDEDGNEQTRLGVRYSELLAFIISAI